MSGEVEKTVFSSKNHEKSPNSPLRPSKSLKYGFTIGFGKGSHYFSWPTKNFEILEFEAKNQKSDTSVFSILLVGSTHQISTPTDNFKMPNNSTDLDDSKFSRKIGLEARFN